MFCQFQTHDKRYGRVIKRIWDINTVFLPVLFKIIKARENLSSRNSYFVCNSLEVSNIENDTWVLGNTRFISSARSLVRYHV